MWTGFDSSLCLRTRYWPRSSSPYRYLTVLAGAPLAVSAMVLVGGWWGVGSRVCGRASPRCGSTVRGTQATYVFTHVAAVNWIHTHRTGWCHRVKHVTRGGGNVVACESPALASICSAADSSTSASLCPCNHAPQRAAAAAVITAAAPPAGWGGMAPRFSAASSFK